MTRDLLAACRQGLRAARAQGAEAAEIFALRQRGGAVEIQKGHLSAAEWEESEGYGLRVVRDRRVGFAYATRTKDFPAAARAALEAARIGEELPAFSFARPARARRVAGLLDERVADADPSTLLDLGRGLLDAVADVRDDLLVAGGGVDASVHETALLNTEGLERSDRQTGLSLGCYVVQRRDGVSTGFATAESTRLDLDPAAVGREAGDLAVASSKAQPLARGARWPCLVRPDAAADLLSTITVPSLYGKPAHRGESYYSGKIGRRVLHASLGLVEDPTTPRGLGSTPFDDEGTPARPVRPIARGVLRTYLYDRSDAARYGAKSTGNALRSSGFEGRSYKGPPSTSGHQFRLEAPRRPTEKLLAGLDRGLVLYDLMGVHTANTASGDFSVTSSVLFEVRKGAIERAVAPLSIAGNLHRALRRPVVVGDDAKALGGSPAWTMPSVLFEGFTATP